MKKNLILSLGLALSLFTACKKETTAIKKTETAEESNSSGKPKINVVNPGGSNIVYIRNGRYYANIAGMEVDLGNVYFYTGPYLDGQAVVAVDNYCVGGPYISVTYSYLVGAPQIDFQTDVQKYSAAFNKFINGATDPSTGLLYQLPNPDSYIHSFYGEIGVFKGVLVRDHGVASTVVIKAASFVPVNFAPTPVE
jgi:hypothetical protein